MDDICRRIASANDALRAAQRDGHYAGIRHWFDERERLLDEYAATRQKV